MTKPSTPIVLTDESCVSASAENCGCSEIPEADKLQMLDDCTRLANDYDRLVARYRTHLNQNWNLIVQRIAATKKQKPRFEPSICIHVVEPDIKRQSAMDFHKDTGLEMVTSSKSDDLTIVWDSFEDPNAPTGKILADWNLLKEQEQVEYIKQAYQSHDLHLFISEEQTDHIHRLVQQLELVFPIVKVTEENRPRILRRY